VNAPKAQAESVPDLDLDAAGQICGPQLPSLQDLYLAQDAPCEANLAGCSDAVYDRLVLERQQTELAFLAGYDRSLENPLECEAEAAMEAADEWDCADSNAYQARVDAGLEPEAEAEP
jgi:hypothetical protein